MTIYPLKCRWRPATLGDEGRQAADGTRAYSTRAGRARLMVKEPGKGGWRERESKVISGSVGRSVL